MKVKKTTALKAFEATCESIGFPLHPHALGKTRFLPTADQIRQLVAPHFEKIGDFSFGSYIERQIHILSEEEVEIKIVAEVDILRTKETARLLVQEMEEQEFQFSPQWEKVGFVPYGTKVGKTSFIRTGTKMVSIIVEPSEGLLCTEFEVELCLRVSYTKDKLPSESCAVVPTGYTVVCPNSPSSAD